MSVHLVGEETVLYIVTHLASDYDIAGYDPPIVIIPDLAVGILASTLSPFVRKPDPCQTTGLLLDQVKVSQ